MDPRATPVGRSGAYVVIVAPDPAERERLRQCLPPDVLVCLADTGQEALGLLSTQAVAPGSLTAAGARLSPDGTLHAERSVSLTPLEQSMLECLLSPPGSVWSLLALSEAVWGTSFVGDGSQVRAVLKRLRRKLVAAGAGLQIESVRGRGLRAVARAGSQAARNCPTTAPGEALPDSSYGT